MNLEECIEKWEIDKKKNTPEMKEAVINYMLNRERFYNFSGENGYFGFTATMEDCYSAFHGTPRLEFAYTSNEVRVFTADHEGFYTPEYLDLEGHEAESILGILKAKLLEWGGF